MPMFIKAFSTIAKMWKQPRCPLMYEWINKIWYIHTVEHYSAIRRKEIMVYATQWVNLEDNMLNEMCKTQKEKYLMIPLI